jgi:hypothetical protein
MCDKEYRNLTSPFKPSFYASKYLDTKDKNVTAPKTGSIVEISQQYLITASIVMLMPD